MDLTQYCKALEQRCIKARKVRQPDLSQELKNARAETLKLITLLKPDSFLEKHSYEEVIKRLDTAAEIIQQAVENPLKKKTLIDAAIELFKSIKKIKYVDSKVIKALKEYHNFRMDPNALVTGDILAQISNPKKFSAILADRLFKMLGNSSIDHIMMAINVSGRVHFGDIVTKGVRYKEFSPQPGSIYIAMRCNLTSQQKQVIFETFMKLRDKKPEFSNLELLGAYGTSIWQNLLNRKKPLKNMINVKSRYYCVEFIHKIYLAAGINLLPKPGNTLLTIDVLHSSHLEFVGLIYDDSAETQRLLAEIAKDSGL